MPDLARETWLYSPVGYPERWTRHLFLDGVSRCGTVRLSPWKPGCDEGRGRECQRCKYLQEIERSTQ